MAVRSSIGSRPGLRLLPASRTALVAQYLQGRHACKTACICSYEQVSRHGQVAGSMTLSELGICRDSR